MQQFQSGTLAGMFAALLGMAGCRETAALAIGRDGGRATAPMDGPTGPTGVGGGAGGCQCLDDQFCAQIAEDQVQALRKPRQLDRRFIGFECVVETTRLTARPAVCLCYLGFGGSTEKRRENALVLGNRTGCDVESRAPGCLSRCGDFAGCTPGDDRSCERPCAELEAKVARDEAAVFDAQVRRASCHQPSCLCRIVIRVEGRCYTNLGPFAPSYDCNLGDDAILAMSMPPLPPSSGRDGATGTPVTRDDAGALACDPL